MDKKLTRDTRDKMVAGVAAGLAKYFQLDVTWVRIAFALAAFFGGGGLWIYIILWIAVPEDKQFPFTYTDTNYKVNKDEPNNYGSTFKPKEKLNINLIGGLLLIGFGAYFLLDEFNIIPYWFRLGKLWPLVFVVIGLSILFKANQQSKTNEFDASDFKKKAEDTSEEKTVEADQTDQTDNYNK